MHINIADIKAVELSPGVLERILLQPEESESGNLTVKHHVIKHGNLIFTEEGAEFQHYIISGSALMRGIILHGDTGIFVPNTSRFGESHKHMFTHMGEGELRILTVIYKTPRANFRWAKTRIKNLNQTEGSYSGMYAQQIFTEEEHALMGSMRMHSLDVQTHAPGVLLPIHKNPEEFAYILRGAGEILSGDKWIKVKPGSLVYTREGVQHAVKNSSGEHPLQYIAFEFTKQDESWTEMGIH
ncbi:cupin domain-containing protein [Candidatus Bathyarchaeota archaeon]|nr:MAG: cupin domain-containing protein [Candidatus Bathyarchaeota archaeon]